MIEEHEVALIEERAKAAACTYDEWHALCDRLRPKLSTEVYEYLRIAHPSLIESSAQTVRQLFLEHRGSVVRRLLAAWDKLPGLRLGQLIENARGIHLTHDFARPDLFVLPDKQLVTKVEAYASAPPPFKVET